MKAQYGITVDKSFASQLWQQIKTTYAGNVDVGIASPQIRELLELYAWTTGQNGAAASVAKARPVSMVQNSSGVYQMPTIANGQIYGTSGGALPVASAASLGLGGGGAMNVHISLNGDSAAKALQGEVVNVASSSPSVFSSGALAGARQSAGRRELAAAMLSPGLTIA